MKKLEVVMKSSAFDLFKESATGLGISEYDVSQVHLSPSSSFRKRQRLYRGQEYREDLSARVKVEFALADAIAKPVAREIVSMLAPDRITIATVEVIDMAAGADQAVSAANADRTTSETPRVLH